MYLNSQKIDKPPHSSNKFLDYVYWVPLYLLVTIKKGWTGELVFEEIKTNALPRMEVFRENACNLFT